MATFNDLEAKLIMVQFCMLNGPTQQMQKMKADNCVVYYEHFPLDIYFALVYFKGYLPIMSISSSTRTELLIAAAMRVAMLIMLASMLAAIRSTITLIVTAECTDTLVNSRAQLAQRGFLGQSRISRH